MSLDIVVGPMFSGKSSRIMSIVSRYTAIDTPVLVLKHASDVRYGAADVVTHDNQRCSCMSVWDLHTPPVEEAVRKHEIVVIEEAQFFAGLVNFVTHAVDHLNKHVYLIGLDGDSNRAAFGEILQCIPLADRVEKLTAFCHRCANGTPGIFTHRSTGPADQQVIVGGSDMYEALCRECYLRA